MEIRKLVTVLVLAVQVTSMTAPIAEASLFNVGVELPIAEIQELIAQLNDAANNVVGEAGVQIRQSIAELSAQMQARIDQLKGAAEEVIRTALKDLRSLINDLITKARSLLGDLNQMIHDQIQCINQALAERLAQAKDAILDILEHVVSAIRDSVNLIYQKAHMLIGEGASSVNLVLDNAMVTAAKVGLLIFALIVIFWMIKAYWTGKIPRKKALRLALPIVTGVLVVGCIFLLVSPSALVRIFGTSVTLPNQEKACSLGGMYYESFLRLKNAGGEQAALAKVGDSALEFLSACRNAVQSDVLAANLQTQIDAIAAILYPPPPSPQTTPVVSNCATHPSFDPRWFSLRDLRKVAVLSKLVQTNKLNANVLINRTVLDTSNYYLNIQRVAGSAKPLERMRAFEVARLRR